MKKYFVFNDKVILIHGRKRGLIHDLNNGKVFSVDEESKNNLAKLLNGNEVSEVIKENPDFIEYLELLVKNNLGKFSDEKKFSGNINYMKKIDNKIQTVWFELRKACNLKCCHCYLDCNYNSDGNLSLLSLNQWKDVVKNLVFHKPKRVTLIGGEPLLFKDIIQLISYIRHKLNCEIILYSNLTLIDDNLVNCLKQYKVKAITSIYSYNEKTHDKITGVVGSYIKTVSNINKLKKNNIYVQANMVVMKENYEDIEETKRFIYKLTGKCGKIDFVRNIGKSKLDLVPNVKNRMVKFNKVKEDEFIRNYSGNSCLQGKINIQCDGYVSPCIMCNKYTNKKYNIKKDSLDKIANEYLIPEFWSLSKDYINKCKDCEFRYACRDCRAKADHRLGCVYDCNYSLINKF